MAEVHTTELKTFKRCRRKWALNVLAALKPQKISTAFMLGSGVHAYLEEFYRQGGAAGGPIAHAAGMQEYFNSIGQDVALLFADGVDESLWFMQEDDILANIDLGVCMLEGYYSYAHANDNFKMAVGGGQPLVELTFAMPIPHPKTGKDTKDIFAGTIDGIIRDTNGYWLMEHKTAKQIKTGHLRQESQATNYMAWAVRQWPKLEGQLRGVLYNYLRKQEPTPNVKAPLFHRERIYRNQHECESSIKNMYYTVQDMHRVAQDPDNLAYPSETPDCTWDCPYRDLCMAMEDGTNVEILLEVSYRVDRNERCWQSDWMPRSR